MTVRADNEFEENYFDSYTGKLGENPEYWSDNHLVFINYSDKNIVKGDVVTVYGIYEGLLEIETIMGQKIKVPSIDAIYIEKSGHEKNWKLL